MMAADRSPTVCDAVEAYACLHSARSVCSVINADKLITARIEAADILVYMEYRVVVSALAVFSLVVYSASFDFYFADGEISLEIGSVILSIPQTELHITVKIYLFCLRRAVHHGHSGELAVLMKRDEYLLNNIQIVFGTFKHRISEAVSALI